MRLSRLSQKKIQINVPGQYTSNKVLDQCLLSCSPPATPPEQERMQFDMFLLLHSIPTAWF